MISRDLERSSPVKKALAVIHHLSTVANPRSAICSEWGHTFWGCCHAPKPLFRAAAWARAAPHHPTACAYAVGRVRAPPQARPRRPTAHQGSRQRNGARAAGDQATNSCNAAAAAPDARRERWAPPPVSTRTRNGHPPLPLRAHLPRAGKKAAGRWALKQAAAVLRCCVALLVLLGVRRPVYALAGGSGDPPAAKERDVGLCLWRELCL